MLADVPVGAFLSGGIDSSTLVSLMQALSPAPVKTFTIGFPDVNFDESSHAQRIARHLGTEHTTWHCADSELLELVNQIPQAYSEPFADDSQLPTMALARLARNQVTVSLSGDGADELFLGYGRYEHALHRWGQVNRHPQIRAGLKLGIDALSTMADLLVDSALKRRWTSQLRRVRRQCFPRHLPDHYGYRMAMIKAPDLYLNRFERIPEFFEQAQKGALRDDLSCLSYLDLHTYLPDDILVKVDRAAMAFSLETRMPFLDHRVVEYAARIPDSVKRFDGRPKWPLRQILARRVPPAFTERPKMGFSPPTGRWLRGPLREWAEGQLAEDRLRREGFFDPGQLRRLWKEHQQGKRNRGTVLWVFLMFQAWHESF
jgi:asparagine synthase (glutamine-hydrolysing)